MKPEPVLTLRIGGKEFRGWTSIEVTLSLDTFSTVDVSAPFDASNADFRRIFRPFSFQSLEVLADGEPLFTGTLVGVEPDSQSDSGTVHCSGYSLPGVLSDCPIPAEHLPAEFGGTSGVKLSALAGALIKPFGLTSQFEADDGAPFKKVRPEVDQTIFDFLADLARQRGLLLSSTPAGRLRCWQATSGGTPVARLVDGHPPVTATSATFSPQSYFSEITGFAQTGRGKKKRSASYSLANQWLDSVLRPHNFRADDTEDGDLPAATAAKLGRMFANTCAFDVELATWRTPGGDIFEPNTTVTMNAPRSMVYRETELLVRNVMLRQDAESATSSLGLVLPGSFSGEVPSELPWME